MVMTAEQQVEVGEIAKQLIKELGLDKVDRKFLPGGGLGDASPGKFKTFGEFLRTAKFQPGDTRLKQLSEGTDSAGGYKN